MELKQVTGKSKKTGKQWTGYYIAIGKFKSPIFFPSDVELWYIENYFKKLNGQSEEEK